MSGVRNMAQGITSLNRLRASIRELPLRLRSAVAKDAEGVLTNLMQDEFAAGRTVYDTPRPLGVKGNRLSLVKTGKTKSALHFVAIGTIVRAQLGTRYAKYLIGKYQIMPQRLPVAWQMKLEQFVREYVQVFEAEAAR